jgi:Flp pilus assembly protein TadG
MALIRRENCTMAKKSRSHSGQAIIEFAFILPLLCIIVLGVIEFGILFYNKAVVTNASREGARAGMVKSADGDGNYWSLTDMQDKVQQVVSDYLQTRLISFGPIGTIDVKADRIGTIHWNGINYYEYTPETIGTVDVKVTYTHTYLALPNFAGWGKTINIGAETIMRLE